MDPEKRLQYSILRYLEGLRARSGGDELTVAIECLGQALNIDVQNKELEQYSIAPLTLPEVFVSGLNSLENPRFKKFYQILAAKGFFAGVQEGTAAYTARLALMREKYEAKYAEQLRASTLPSSSSTTSFSNSPSPQPPSSHDSSSSSSSSFSHSFSSDPPSASSSISSPPGTPAPPSYAESIQPSTEQKTAANKRKLEGNAALAQGRINDAIQAYSAAIELNPFDAVFWTNRAAAHANVSHWEQARSDAENAVRLDAHYPKAHYRLGQALLNLGRGEESIVAFENAVRLTANEADKEPIRQQLQQARNLSQPTSTPHPDSQQGGLNLDDVLQGNLGSMFQNNPQMMQMMQGLQQGIGSLGNLFGGGSADSSHPPR